jgi:hypothetical protein
LALKMKRCAIVTLVISGALLAGCDDSTDERSYDGGQMLTNNAYSPGHGYWHAPYHDWYPYPYNYYLPGRGYYHGGIFTEAPHESAITASRPAGFSAGSRSASTVSRGGFGFSGSAHS